jgi:hypothetical protein
VDVATLEVLFRDVGRAIDGVLTFHFLGGESVADLFRESSAQRSGLGAFFDRNVT